MTDRGPLLQLVGVVVVAVGVFLLAGLAWTLTLAGVAVVVYGFLLERSKVRSKHGSGSPPRT